MDEKKIDETGIGTDNKETNTPDIVNQDSKVKKAVKWLIKGLVVVATGAVGYFLGRGSVGNDDDSDTEESSTEE